MRTSTALTGGCMAKNDSKEEIVRRFRDAEEHSTELFALMDQLAEEVGGEVNMSEVLA
jgi:hypothetical protein